MVLLLGGHIHYHAASVNIILKVKKISLVEYALAVNS